MKLRSLVAIAVVLIANHAVAQASGFLPLGDKAVKTNTYKKSFASDQSGAAKPSTASTNATSSTHDARPELHNGGVNLHPYTAEIQNYILQAHNKARATLVPTEAANMRKLTWDESLAIEASELVETCIFKHDTEGYQYGQNLIYGGAKLDKAAVDDWMVSWVMEEISDSDRSAKGFMNLDHASAVLWATTHLVGCASKLCPHGHYTVCNYYSPGNWMGARTYIPGKSCSQCPTEAPHCDEETGKLCAAQPRPSGGVATERPAAASATAPVPAPTARPVHRLCH